MELLQMAQAQAKSTITRIEFAKSNIRAISNGIKTVRSKTLQPHLVIRSRTLHPKTIRPKRTLRTQPAFRTMSALGVMSMGVFSGHLVVLGHPLS